MDPAHEQSKDSNPNTEDPKSENTTTISRNSLTSMASGTSISEIKDHVATVSGEKATLLKDTVLGSAIPAADEVLQNAKSAIGSIACGRSGSDETSALENGQLVNWRNYNFHLAVPKLEQEYIDNMDPERISDFLRDKYKSPSAPSTS
ncbi:hypothetical protein N7495_006911 [Penicillium taxi]|uniref:uncharacterized protein n=1 Tax=Penicillium taxi TaxID=168475 RepID=UPI00254572C5|nr:uncharacterized protein N7495_006911 [Penicillium taxi]KAJ5895220.1 hypothetical protein N7495_006911 [Penicillium taxi]